jgi:uncharacterized membrane protein
MRPDAGTPWGLVLLFALGGVLHFAVPGVYERMMPRWLPPGTHRPLVLLSGVAELAGALALLAPAWRVAAGWWLIATLLAVFPANVQMLHDARTAGAGAWQQAALWLRLPLQPALAWWIWRAAIAPG